MAKKATHFEVILGLKERREEKARNEVKAWRLRLNQANAHVTQCEREAEEFSAWLLEEQKRLYDGLEERVVERPEIDKVRERIAAMRLEEGRRYDKIKEAEKARDETARQTQAAERAHAEAQRTVEKFEELVEIEATKRAIEAQAAEEKEMEDFTKIRDPLA